MLWLLIVIVLREDGEKELHRRSSDGMRSSGRAA